MVWSAGIDTWRRLAARGIWVHGSDESLGEGGVLAAKSLFPRVRQWIKFSHEQGYDSPFSERVATYRLERCTPLADLSGRTHFYWRSGAQFYDYLQANPEIRGAWHGCGPGNTFSMIRAAIGEERVRAAMPVDARRGEARNQLLALSLIMAGYLFALAYLASFVTYRVVAAMGVRSRHGCSKFWSP